MIALTSLLIIGVVVLIVICIIGIFSEKKDYNNGICPKCGQKLHHFDNDSQGGRGYICDKCNYTTWVSYPFIDKK